MASIEGCSTGEATKKVIPRRVEACHQCRKRNDAERPCSNCKRTHNKVVRINPHLSHIAPNCTYDESEPLSAPSEKSEDYSEQNLLKLEARIEELERQLRSASQTPRASPSTSPIHGTQEHLGAPTESFVDIPSDYDHSSYIPTNFSIMAEDWPLELPPKPLMLHLIDLFFTCYPHSRRIIHRPTFFLQLLEHPSSPRFPFIPLLHSICAAAAAHSPYVTVAPLPDLSKYPVDEIFPEKTRANQGRTLAFDEQHYHLCKYQCMASEREGGNLFGVVQACVVNAWWAFSTARWLDVWAMNSRAMRLCVALGLNFADSLYKPLPAKAREKLLIGPPISHIDVELRRNAFWISYCLERYNSFAGQWVFDVSDLDIQQTLPATLEAFETGRDDGQERQHILSSDLLSTHYSNQDDFTMYVKCAIMLSQAHLAQLRRLPDYETPEEARDSQEMKSLESMISSIRLSLKKQFNPVEQLSPQAISNTFIAHMAPLATIKLHLNIANWRDPTCDSANKCLAAARDILRYTTALASTSFDFSRLDSLVCAPWLATGIVLLYSLKLAPESLVPILRAEIRLVRSYLRLGGNRAIIFLRQLRSFDMDVVQALGDREAAKLFEGDSL